MPHPIVVDLSHHQPDPINWDAVKAGGTVGIIHKATEGVRYVDPTLFAHCHDAKLAGLLTMTYHFLRPGHLVGQVEHYLATIDPVQGERVVLDHEDEGVSLADLESAVKAIRRLRPDLRITVYSGHLIKDQLGGQPNPFLAEHTDLWLAQYGAVPTWPKRVWPQWSLWQYSQTERAAGIMGRVDGNKWNGTDTELRQWMAPAGSVPIEPSEPEKQPILIAVSVPPGSGPVTVTINGEILTIP